jgi:hypothetical protein
MNRTVEFRLNNVTPTPPTLRTNPQIDTPAREVNVDLGQLFLHYYFDSYPLARPSLNEFATRDRQVTPFTGILKKIRNLINPRYRRVRCPGQELDIGFGPVAPANHITKRTCSCDIPPVRGNK